MSGLPNERELLLAILDLPTFERAAYLDHACNGSPELKARIQHLLDNVQSAGGFMAAPAIDLNTAPTLESIDVGRQIDRYKLMEQVGEGGMGVVFVAVQTAPVRRRVALKVIKPGMDSKAVIARFEAERQALALMHHPNIAQVLDAGTTSERLPYFVMELVCGLPITTYCDDAKASIADRLRLFIDVCNAVQHAHQKGIIHRDLKPSNILVTLHDGRPVVKVIDFGVAKALHQQLTQHTLYTALHQVVGTPLYMSPEQVELSGLDIDTRADVYALGVLLYELLTGATPFDRDRLLKSDFDEMRRIIREEVPPRPSSRVTTMHVAKLSTVAEKRGIDQRALQRLIESELDWIVLKSLEKDRNRRYESASAFRGDVERYLHDEPVLACPPSRAYLLSKWYQRHRFLIAATAMVMISLLAGLVGTVMQTKRALRAESLAETRLENEREARDKADRERDKANWEKRRADDEAERAGSESLRAQQEAEVAIAMSDFLQKDLLAQIDISTQLSSGETPNPDITLATLLDRASEKIEGRFNDLPVVEGSLHYTMAQCYRSLGKYDIAMEHVRRAVELGRSVIGENHPGTLRAICLQGSLALMQGDLTTAEALLNEARQGIVENGDEAGVDGRHVIGQLLVLKFEQGKHEEAKEIAEGLLELCRATLGDDAPDTLTAMSNLAVQRSALGESLAAIALHRQVYEVRLRTLGAMHPDTLESVRNLAVQFDKQGDYPQAQAMFEEVLEGYSKHYGADHPKTLFVKSNLGLVLISQSKTKEAESLLIDAVGKLESSLGKDHSAAFFAWSCLATVYEETQRFDDCLNLRQLVLDRTIQQLGESHPDVVTARGNYATALKLVKRPNAADKEFRQAIESSRKILGDEHPTTLTLLNNLGVLYYESGDYERALEMFRGIETVRVKREGEASFQVQCVRISIASVLHPLGRVAEARDLLRNAIKALDATVGQTHPMASDARRKLAEQLESDKSLDDRFVQAEVLHRQLLDSYTGTLGLENSSTASTRLRLIKNLASQNRMSDMQEFCSEQLLRASQLWGENDSRTLGIAFGLGSAVLTAGQPAEAEGIYRLGVERTQDLRSDDALKSCAISGLVNCLNRLGRHDEALQLIESAVADLESINAKDSPAMKQMKYLFDRTNATLRAPDAAATSQ